MSSKKGFTLIEVVVVTLIIAALALLVVPSFKNSALTNQMEKAKIGLVEFTTAVKLYNEVNTTPLSGDFDSTMFNALTNVDDPQGYIYLRNGNRWAVRTGNLMSLRDGDNGVLNCTYYIGNQANADILSYTECSFDKIDEDGKECYRFYVPKSNPAVLKKESIDCAD